MGFVPVMIKDADLVLGSEAEGTDFAIQLTSIALTPDSSVETLVTAKKAGRFNDVNDPTWNLDLTYAYGRDTASPWLALSEYLRLHHGEELPFEFRPVSGDETLEYTGTCKAVAGALGGDVGGFSTQSVSLPVTGQPTGPELPAPPAG